MDKHGDALWTFVDVEGVEPTNNRAERAIRHAVLWRKSSFGTHSEAGSRFVERMLTVRTSLRAQSRSVVHYVTQAVESSLRGLPVPSLLPQPQPAALALAA
jgi:transposase